MPPPPYPKVLKKYWFINDVYWNGYIIIYLRRRRRFRLRNHLFKESPVSLEKKL